MVITTGTTVVTKEIKQAKGGSYCVYVPYQWNDKDVLISFIGEDYRILATKILEGKKVVADNTPKNGRVTIKVHDYKEIYPAGSLGRIDKDGNFIGKQVIAILIENFELLEDQLMEAREFLESQRVLKVEA